VELSLVVANSATGFFRQLLLVALYGSGGFTLTLSGGLFVELTSACFGQDARFFTGALE